MIAIYPLRPHWVAIMSAVSALTMTVGNIAAITQSNVKRLLAYSSISHAGYILIGLIAGNETGMIAIPMYLADLHVHESRRLGGHRGAAAERRDR